MPQQENEKKAPEQSDVEKDITELAAGLGVFLKGRRDEVAPQLAAAIARARAIRPTATAEELLPGVLAALDFGRWVDGVGLVEPALEIAHVDGGADALAAFGALNDHTEAMVETFARESARRRAAELFGFVYVGDELVPRADLPASIADSTRRMLSATVRDAIEEGMTEADLTAALEDAYVFSDQRAWAIARYEILSAANESTLRALTRINRPLGKQWLTVGDDKVEEICDGNAAQGVIPLHQPFRSGDMSPLAHPNCRCALRVVPLPLPT